MPWRPGGRARAGGLRPGRKPERRPVDPATFLTSLPALPDFARKRLASLESTPALRRKRGIDALVSALERRTFYVPFGTPVIPELFSARLGCKVFQPAYFGVDLAALCVRRVRRFVVALQPSVGDASEAALATAVPRPEEDERQQDQREEKDMSARGDIHDRGHRQSDQEDEDDHRATACPRWWNGNPALGHASSYRCPHEFSPFDGLFSDPGC
jgi:hypothetical protein